MCSPLLTGFDGPKAVLGYLAGYVVGTAIHDGRIKRYDGRCVVIEVKNYRTGEQEELFTWLSTLEHGSVNVAAKPRILRLCDRIYRHHVRDDGRRV